MSQFLQKGILVYKNYKLTASNFEFDRKKNILNANKNVEFNDKENKIKIYSNKIKYQKNKEIILTKGNSKAVNKNNTITASNFKFDRIKNILTAENKVKFKDEEDDFIVFSDNATYFKNDNIIVTKGNSKAVNKNI